MSGIESGAEMKGCLDAHWSMVAASVGFDNTDLPHR
jgi:hypothetical protein